MSTIFRGTLAPLLQKEVWDFDPSRGFIHRLDFKGASQANMLSQQQYYVNLGIACRLEYNQGDTASLFVDDSSMSILIDTWEIVGNDETRDLFSHSIMFNYLTSDQIAQLRNFFNTGTTPTDAKAGMTWGAVGSTAQNQIMRLYGMYYFGQTDFRRAQYVLRHKTNAPSRYAVNIADVGVEQIYTPAQLLTETQNSSLWVYPLPDRLAYKIANIPTPAPVSSYQWGWLKSPSTETTAANNRIDITTEYTLELWSADIYAPH